jgi:hypothetical protein
LNLLVVVGITLGACAVTILLLLALHRYGPRDVLVTDSARGAAIYTVVGTSFAVIVAFVVLIAFESFNDAKDGSEQEADAVLELFRAADFFDRAERVQLQGELVCYGRAVVAHDWPVMNRDGGRSATVDHWSFSLQEGLEALQVHSPQEQAAFADLLDLSQDRVNARRLRLTQASSTVTAPVWVILGLGALVNIGLALLFIDRRSESLVVQAMMLASLTAVVVGALLLIYFLDHPYADATGGIKPSEMENAVSVMREQEPELATPCNAAGDPVGREARGRALRSIAFHAQS